MADKKNETDLNGEFIALNVMENDRNRKLSRADEDFSYYFP